MLNKEITNTIKTKPVYVALKDLRIGETKDKRNKPIHTYYTFESFLADKQVKRAEYQTWIEKENPHHGKNINIRLYDTNIITIHAPELICPEVERVSVNTKSPQTLFSDSRTYRTALTARRINFFLPRGVHIFQQQYKWYWRLYGKGIKDQYYYFNDGDVLVKKNIHQDEFYYLTNSIGIDKSNSSLDQVKLGKTGSPAYIRN